MDTRLHFITKDTNILYKNPTVSKQVKVIETVKKMRETIKISGYHVVRLPSRSKV